MLRIYFAFRPRAQNICGDSPNKLAPGVGLLPPLRGKSPVYPQAPLLAWGGVGQVIDRCISDSFPKMHINDKINVSVKAMCRVAAKKLLNKALHICREHAGSLLQAARLVQSMELTEKNDFGDGCHIFNICVNLQNISTIIVFNTQKNLLFYLKGRCKMGENCPFSHKRKLMSLISLYNFIANISFQLLFVNYFIFSSRERKWKRKGRRQEKGPKGKAEKYNKFKNL